ncbi:MAG: D-glycero-beta-D-manno-heptose-7-phosphate kinase [Chlamydiae bacterium]|nr:D-glycero-beta-D-manno-heptose-7-phosphate kinase [Chlamydiota bacterium]MBI3267068.1 D-glycero-beta-D-manno-heptose-7-phosphate kinase [Chlamydiota bacterium]
MMHSKYKKILSRFHSAKIYVVGDLILDCFVWGKVRRISPEAPVPVVEVEKDSYVPGGAANVASNIAALGAKVWISGVVGKDDEARELISLMRRRKIDTSPVLQDKERPTSLKTRVVAHQQQVVRIDRETLSPLDGKQTQKFLSHLSKIKNRADVILIEDYGKGVVNQDFVNRLIHFAKREEIPIGVDPKKGHFLDYRGIAFATPNFEEASYFAGIEGDDDSRLDEAGRILLDRWEAQAILVTLGAKGMCLFEKNEEPYLIPTRAREVYDVSGAGDTVIASFAVSMACGAGLKDAAQLANVCAGVVVGKLGTAVVYKSEIEKELENVS